MIVGFEIPGDPVGKGRPRFSRNKYTGRVHTRTPQQTVNYENLVKMCYIEQVKDRHFDKDKEIFMNITAYVSIPASASKKKAEAMLHGDILPAKKPDIDNLAKSIMDAVNGIAYYDDKQVVTLHVSKKYSDVPHVDVIMMDYDEFRQTQAIKTDCLIESEEKNK